MKTRFIPLFVFFIASTFGSFAQVAQEGTVFIDAYYGFPDWRKTYFDNDYRASNYTVNVNSTNHIGGRFEYLVTRHIGFGVDIWYVKTTAEGTNDVTTYNNYPSPSSTTTVNFTKSLSRLSYLGRFNIHFGSSKKVDPYVHVGFGYTNYGYKFTSSNKSLYYDTFDYEIPLAFRTGFGIRFMFSEHLGANFDMGLGGPLFTAGLSAKF